MVAVHITVSDNTPIAVTVHDDRTPTTPPAPRNYGSTIQRIEFLAPSILSQVVLDATRYQHDGTKPNYDDSGYTPAQCLTMAEMFQFLTEPIG